jgi:hypothetical protein
MAKRKKNVEQFFVLKYKFLVSVVEGGEVAPGHRSIKSNGNTTLQDFG